MMKTKKSLLKFVVTRNMPPFEIDRIKRLIAHMQQYNRLRFTAAIPREYSDAVTSLKGLIPQEMRQSNYVEYDITCRPSYHYMAEAISALLASAARYTTSSIVRDELTRVIDSAIYEPTDLSDISSSDSSYAPSQEVPDNDVT